MQSYVRLNMIKENVCDLRTFKENNNIIKIKYFKLLMAWSIQNFKEDQNLFKCS